MNDTLTLIELDDIQTAIETGLRWPPKDALITAIRMARKQRGSAEVEKKAKLYEWLQGASWVGFQYSTGRPYPFGIESCSCKGTELTAKINEAMLALMEKSA